MENKKLVDLDLLAFFKGLIINVINKGDEKAFKAVDCSDNTIKLYKKEDKSDSAPVKLALLSPVSFSLETNAWQTLSVERNGFGYYAEIEISGLTASDYVRVDFSFDSIAICEVAEVSASGETESGKIILYAKNIPSATINGIYCVQKGVV